MSRTTARGVAIFVGAIASGLTCVFLTLAVGAAIGIQCEQNRTELEERGC